MNKYKEFLRIAKHLNKELDITPILYGSLGLSRLIQEDLKSEDIDILVPQKYITTNWDKLQKVLLNIGYQLINEKEHEFIYKNNKIGIAHEEDLLPFAGVNYKKLKTISDDNANYKILNLDQYKKVYGKSEKDSYRSQQNNKKDIKKIKLINNYLKIWK